MPRLKDWQNGQASKILRKYLQELEIIPSDAIIKQEKKDGVKNPKNTIRLHDLRGISISHSLAGGKEALNAVMERVGHKTLSTTSLYLKNIEDHQNVSVANRLDFAEDETKREQKGEVIDMSVERIKRRV